MPVTTKGDVGTVPHQSALGTHGDCLQGLSLIIAVSRVVDRKNIAPSVHLFIFNFFSVKISRCSVSQDGWRGRKEPLFPSLS